MKKGLLYIVFTCLCSLKSFSQRNIIVIIADDLGSEWCGFQEDHKDTVNLKNVRTLLSRGVRFANAWATPYCSPTRAGILTGRYSFRHGIGTAISDANSAALSLDEVTIPQLLKHTNAPTKYVTANVGKWHLHDGNTQTFNYPQTFGYDYFAGVFSGVPMPSYSSWRKVTNGTPSLSNNYLTTETTKDAINWLTGQGNKPFFLWLAYNAPHSPFHLPPDSLHSYDNLSGTQTHINQNPTLYFKAMAESLDYEIGKLFSWLKANNKYETTDIIFIGDNGSEERVSQGPADRSKGSVYENGIHVPFIIAGPSVVRPGRVSNALVCVQDIFATVLELGGFTNWTSAIPVNRDIDSKSMLPVLKNQVTDVRTTAYTEVFKTSVAEAVDSRAIRNKTYKLIHFDSGEQEMYNLTTDAGESKNMLTQALSNVEQQNYQSLCAELGELLGINACQQTTVSVKTAAPGLGPKIAPNPVQNQLFVTCPDGYAFSFELFDSFGRSIVQGKNSSNIPVEHLPVGLYILQVRSEGTTFTEKILVNR